MNDIAYEGSTYMLNERSKIKSTVTIKYNNNPKEYVVNSGWNSSFNTLLIGGIIITLISLVLLILFKIFIKKLSNKVSNIEKGN